MARVNVESQWWSDPRRMKLILKIGFCADSAAVNMWRVAQEYWGRNFGLVPKHVFDSLEYSAELVDCGLAVVRECSVYVRGSKEWLSWLYEQREQASAAGKKSVEVRRKKHGTAQPQKPKTSNDSRTPPERNSNALEPSVSVSGSKKNDEEGKPSSPLPASYQAFSDSLDPERVKIRELAEEVISDLLGRPPNPGFRKKILGMLRAVDWDWNKFAGVAAEAKGAFEGHDSPPTVSYREITLLCMFGLREAS